MAGRTLNTKEAAEIMGLAPNTLNKWRMVGRGPRHVKHGDGRNARVAYFEEDILIYLNRHTNHCEQGHLPEWKV